MDYNPYDTENPPETKRREQSIATRRCKIWCTLKDDVYTPISLESTYEPPKELVGEFHKLGFGIVQVEAIIWGKVFPTE